MFAVLFIDGAFVILTPVSNVNSTSLYANGKESCKHQKLILDCIAQTEL